MDRQLPFLCVYRQPVRASDPGTARLATTEAAYLTCSGRKNQQPGLSALVLEVGRTMVAEFGAFIVVEIWAGPPSSNDGPVTTAELTPAFRVVAQKGSAKGAMIDVFSDQLGRIRMARRRATVTTTTSGGACSSTTGCPTPRPS